MEQTSGQFDIEASFDENSKIVDTSDKQEADVDADVA